MFAEHTIKVRALVRTKYEDEFVFINPKGVKRVGIRCSVMVTRFMQLKKQ